jgi:hypothetical protein
MAQTLLDGEKLSQRHVQQNNSTYANILKLVKTTG